MSAHGANIDYVGGLGPAFTVGAELFRDFPSWLAAILLGAVVLLPAGVFTITPSRAPDQHLASESFRKFSLDVLPLLRRREILIASAFSAGRGCAPWLRARATGSARQHAPRLA